jgi:hypothetical protein
MQQIRQTNQKMARVWFPEQFRQMGQTMERIGDRSEKPRQWTS